MLFEEAGEPMLLSRLVQDGSPLGLEAANRSALDLFRRPFDELLAHPPEGGYWRPSDARDSSRIVAEVAVRGSAHFEAVWPRADGYPVPVEVTVSRFSLGGAHYGLTVARDLTQRKEVEQLQSDLVSMVAHELRNPLSAVVGFATLIERSDDTPDHRMRDMAATIHRKAAFMDRLVEDLLEATRIKTGHLMLELKTVDIASLVGDCVAAAETAFEEHPIRVEIRGSLPDITADPDRLAYAIRNLLSNAAKYSDAGTEITVTLAARDGLVTIAVADKGLGIPQDKVEALFERYARADQPEAARRGGYGIGLFAIKKIIAAHAGFIDVKSALDEGSTFTISLPVTGPPAEVSPELVGRGTA